MDLLHGRLLSLSRATSVGGIVTSPLEVMLRNQIQGLHTLVLFDLDPTGAGTGDQRPMQPVDAFTSIQKMSQKLSESDVDDSLKVQV